MSAVLSSHRTLDTFSPDTLGEEIAFFGDSQTCCVCIVDMVNSTKTMAEISDVEKIRKCYSIFLNTMAFLAKNYGAKIIKNLGDGLMYYFPGTADPTNSDSFKELIECCLTSIAAHGILNKKLSEEKLPSISYRISADYGKLEIARSATSQTYDLFGSTINICAKINSKAQPNCLVIGSDLYQILKSYSPSFENDYQFQQVGEYRVGFRYSYPIYSVVAKKNNRLDNDCASVQLERIPALKNVRQQTTTSAATTAQHTSATILVVDDEADALFTYSSLLSAEGYNVKAFRDPEEALKHFAQLSDPSCYHLILLDIRMPGLNGLQLFYRIKSLSPNSKTMFVSALDVAEELVSILPGVKYDDVIKKPIKREHFIRKIKAALYSS